MPPIVKKILVRGFLGLTGAVILLYVGDAIQIRIRLATGGTTRAYDTVTVLYAAGLKGSKMEIYTDLPQSVTCARAIFPQMGYSPCWYVRQNTTQMLN